MITEEMLSVIKGLTLEAIFQVLRVAVKYRKGQNHLKNCSTFKDCFGQTTHL